MIGAGELFVTPAGQMVATSNGDGKFTVKAVAKKGELVVIRDDHASMHLAWRERSSAHASTTPATDPSNDMMCFADSQMFLKVPMADATRSDDPIFVLAFKQGTNRRFFWLQTPTAAEGAPATTAQRNVAIASKINALINGRAVDAATEATAAGTAAPVAAAAAAAIDATAGDLGDFSNLLGAVVESDSGAAAAPSSGGLSMEHMIAAAQQAMAGAAAAGEEDPDATQTQPRGSDDDDDAMYED